MIQFNGLHTISNGLVEPGIPKPTHGAPSVGP